MHGRCIDSINKPVLRTHVVVSQDLDNIRVIA